MKLIVLDCSLTSKGVQDENSPILNPYTHYNYSVKTSIVIHIKGRKKN